MAERNISNSALRTALINGDPFEYAHLVKFERPFASKNGDFRTNANRYVYLTDGQRDITFDGNTYRASGLITVGSYAETTQAKATNMSLTLPGEFLGTKFSFTGNFASSGKIRGRDADNIDFFEEGFREGDKVRLTRTNGTDFSDGDNQKDFIITGFELANERIVLARTGTDNDDSAFLSSGTGNTGLTLELINEEYKGATMEKGTTSESTVTADNTATITLASTNSQIERGQLVSGPGILDETIVKSINGTTLTLDRAQPRVPAGAKLVFTNPSFVNREVFVYKAYINPETGATYGDPILTFKGIIASTNIQESPNSSKVQWNLTSHWGDFQEVRGRLTKDEIHRALDANGLPNKNLTIRPEYASDLGFLHAETSLNTIAVYQTTETRFRVKSKKRGGLAGFVGMKKYYEEEYQVQVDNEVDLSVHLQGSYLPVVYGVHRINGIPVFADTKNDNSKEVYVVYALAEGKVHGLYNAYIDGSPLICVDKPDFDVRNASNGTDGENTQLQCYGRADIGNTLSGNIVQSNTETEIDYDEEDLYYTDSQGNTTRQNSASVNDSREGKYNAVDESNIPTLTAGDATGLRHKETFSISHPYSMFFTFYQGKHDQVGDNNLTTIAQANGFKRQSDYYSGEKLYWSPNHKLLDTAYVVMKFTIDADQTTIPEVEYVIKGKVIECFNYDGTFVPDPVYSTANGNGSNFNEGDSVTVEVSANGTSWSSDGGGTYRILDKYLFTPAEGSSYLRFRLDRNPVVGTNQYIRLNDGSSNYWSMITYDQAVIKESDNISFPAADQIIATNVLSTNSNGVLNATLTNAQETKLTTLYPDLASSTTKREPLQITGGTGIFANLRNKVNRAKYNASTNLLTFVDAQFSANQTSNSGQPLNGASIVSGTKFDFSNVSALASLSSNARVVGAKLKVIETGEERTILGFDTSTNILTIDTPFIDYPTSSMKITISGVGKDERASINPAIQLTDMLTNDRFGKALDLENDIDLPSIKESALLCDTRSDITVPLGSTASCVAGDIYKLVDGSGNHVASGKVKASTSSTSSVVLTDVSGKFTRGYQDYITYKVGDIVYNLVGNTTRYYRVTTAGLKATAPTHVSGTTNGLEYISSVSLSKVSGSGPSSLSLALDGRTIEYSLYDSDYVKYWRYLGWEENRQYAVTRHQTNFIFATERPIFENINALLSHFNGQLSYSNGKYSLSVETGESAPTSSISDGIQQNPEFITDDDIIGTISLNDNAQKNAKNTIKASIVDPQNNFQSRSVSFFNSDFLKADRGKIKTGNYPVTGITSYYNARMGVEKELIQTRYSKEVSFTIGPKGLLLKPGEVIGLTYKPFGFENKLFRIQNLNYQANCTTSVKATEYNDNIYAITPQIASNAQRSATGGNFGLEAPGAPTNLTTGTAKPGIITLNWTNATDYKETIDSTEIWRATAQGSSGEITSHATLLTVVDNATTFNDAVGVAGTYYYWIRHRRVSRRTSDNSTVKLLGAFESNINAGVSGVANILSPQLDVDISSFQVKFNASNQLTPGGASQDVTFTATLRNITASNVTFTLVDADGSTTATDGVVFTNSNASLVDSSAPFTATLDASSFSHNTANKFVKVTATDSGTSETFTELVPITVTKDGSSGSIGVDAKAIKLTPSSHVVSYSATGGENTTVSFTTATQGTSGFSGTPNYKFLVGGVQKQSGTTSTFTLAQSDEPAAEATVNVTVQLFDGTPSGSPEATDTVTIFGVKSGADSITAFLTNNSHTVSSNPDGTLASGALDDAGGTFKVFVGTTDRTTSCSFAEASGQETSGLTSNINSSTGVYEVTGLTVDNAVNVFEATIPNNISPTGQAVTIDQTYSISKSRTGAAGSAGTNAKTVGLTSSGYAIAYNSSGSSPSPSGTLTLTATATNFTDPYFKFTGDGLSDETSYTDGSGATDTFTYSIPSSFFSTPKLIRVGVSEAADSSTEVAFDSINITAVKDGAGGADAITAVLTNEAHTLPANSSGTVTSFSGSGTSIQVFKGSTELDGVVSGTPGTGEFRVTPTASNISTGSISSTGNPVVVADHSNMTADVASISYAINVENSLTLTKKQTFSKSKEGAAGEDSLSGVLTNESSTASTFEMPEFAGGGSIIIYTDSGGEFKVFEGASEKTSGVTYGITGGSSSSGSTTKTQNGLTITMNESTGIYSASGLSWNTEAESFTFTATIGSTVIEKVYLINKISNRTPVRLTASSQTFAYDGGSANPSPSTITLTASPATLYTQLPAGAYQFRFLKSTDSGASFSQVQAFSTTATHTVNAGNFSLGNEVYKVEMRYRENASPNTTTLFDEDTLTLLRVKEGTAGSDGTQTANVQIYKRTSSSSAPAKPGNGSTFTFSSGALTGQAITDGWSQTVPGGTSQYLWTCSKTVTATASATSVTINQSDWSTVVLQSEAQVPRTATKRLYYDSWTFGSGLPTITNTQRDAISYNFNTGVCSNLPLNWTTNAASITTPYAYVDITFVESTYEGSYSRTLGDIRVAGGKFDRLDLDDIDINFDSDTNIRVRIGNAGLGTTAFQTGAVPGGLKNSGIALSKVNGNVRLTNTGATTDVTLNNADVGLGLVANKRQVDADLGNAPAAIKNETINIDGSGNLTGTGASGIRVSNDFIASGDISGSGKIFSTLPESGATVGARAGVNLKRNNNQTIGDSDIITSEGTSDDTNNVNSISAGNVTGGITQVNTNLGSFQDSLEDGTGTVNASAISIGSLNTDRLNLQELFLPTTGTATSGVSHSITSSGQNTTRFLFDAGTGPGYYVGHVEFDNTVRTMRGGDIGDGGPVLFLTAGGVTVFQGSMLANHAYERSSGLGAAEGGYQCPFAVFYTGSGTLKVNVKLETTSGTESLAIKGRAVKFGADLASFDTSSFTASRTVSAASGNSDSGTVTVSTSGGGSSSVSLSGNSNALVSVNGGSFTSSPPNISNNQTFEIRIPASNSQGVTRSATVTIDGISATYSVTTSGTYSSGGFGSGGGGTGGLAAENELR